MKLSVAIITMNEEKILETTLNSIKDIADEIIIVDSGSTDRTEEIAKKYNAKFIYKKWSGYGPQRNYAIENCKNQWVLNIDADEEVSPALAKEIIHVINDPNEKREVFFIKTLSVCFGKKIHFGGWGAVLKLRLLKQGTGHFNANNVHEEFITNKEIFILKYKIFHHSYLTLSDYFVRFNRYTSEGALDYFNRGKKISTFKICVVPFLKFIRMYFFRLGFLDGLEGFLLACTSSMYTMVKYYKLRELHKNNTKK